MLDVARATYKEVIEDIYRETVLYKEALPELKSLRIQYSSTKGYHLSLIKDELGALPGEIFISDKKLEKHIKIFKNT